MTRQNVKDKIFSDAEFVFSEFSKLQHLFRLKHVIRYGQERTDPTYPESVAEHVYGMHVLFRYFWPLENPERNWDEARMLTMITFHDIDEIITGDTIGYLKTKRQKAAGEIARQEVLSQTTGTVRDEISDLLAEYEARESIEAKFVKALDKIEPVFQVYNDAGKAQLNRMGTTRDQHDSIKLPYFEPFPVVKRFYDVMIERMEREGFFAQAPLINEA